MYSKCVSFQRNISFLIVMYFSIKKENNTILIKGEQRDLIELATAYPGDYIEVIIGKILKDTSLSKEEIFRMLFGIEMMPEKYRNRPFSKFKNDIINQIHEVLIKEP